MTLTDCYRVLGLPLHANLTQLKQQYRRLARQYHPDSNRGNPQAQEKFILIHQAYQTLRPLVPPEPHPRASKAVSQKTHSSPPRINREQPKHPDAPRTTPAPSASQPRPQAPSKSANVKTSSQTAAARPKPTTAPPNSAPTPSQPSPATPPLQVAKTAAPQPPKSPELPKISRPTPPPEIDLFAQQLKKRSYQQLQELLRYRRFERATILIEGLRQTLPTDAEIRQWQGITYHCWARDLIKKGQSAQACHYLNQARHADPDNYALAQAIEQDFRQLERRCPKRQLMAI